MGTFPACVLSGWCVYGGDRGFVKTFTAWQKLASWQVLANGVGGGAVLGDMFLREYRQDSGGTGGYSAERITV